MIPLKYTFNSIFIRNKTSISIIGGVALFIFVISLVQMLYAGIQKTMITSHHTSDVIVMGTGAGNEMSSFISQTQINEFRARAGSDIESMISEFVIIKLFEKKVENKVGNVIIRGTSNDVTDFRDELTLVEGRLPSPGKNEVMVGSRISERFKNMSVGDTIQLTPTESVLVTGVFYYLGSSFESEIWGELNMIRAFFGRSEVVSSLRVRLAVEDVQTFILKMRTDDIHLKIYPELAFLSSQGRKPQQFISVIGVVFCFFISIAAVIALSTIIRSSFERRRNEIVLMRKMGFSSWSVIKAFLLESSLLGLIGAIIGLLVSLIMTNVKMSIMSVATWSQLVVKFEITWPIVAISLCVGIVMSLIGALVPTIKTVRWFYLPADESN